MLTRVTEILQRRRAERAPAIEKELAQLAAEQQRCRQEGKRVLHAIGGGDSHRSDMTTKRMALLIHGRQRAARGLARCRVCGSPMSPSWSTSRGREYRYYVCTRVERSGRDACSVRAVPAGTIEDFMVKHIRTIAADP